VRLHKKGVQALAWLKAATSTSASEIVRAALRVCRSFVEGKTVTETQEEILHGLWNDLVRAYHKAGFRIIDVSAAVVRNPQARGQFFLAYRPPFPLAKSSASMDVVSPPVPQNVEFWTYESYAPDRKLVVPKQLIRRKLADILDEIEKKAEALPEIQKLNFDALHDRKVSARLRSALEAISPDGIPRFNIISHFERAKENLARFGVKFLDLGGDGYLPLTGGGDDVALDLGKNMMKIISASGSPGRTQPMFQLVMEPIINGNDFRALRNPAAFCLFFDPDRRVKLGNLMQNDIASFSNFLATHFTSLLDSIKKENGEWKIS